MNGDNTLKDISSALNSIYCSKINKLDVDLLNKEMIFNLTLVDGGNVTNHELKFVNCSSFLWLEKNKYAHEAYDFSKCNYYELTSIDIMNITMHTYDDWLKQYPMEYNVVIEIWETALLIKSDEIIIDNQHYLIP